MNRIKELREEKNLYQQELACLLNVKQATVSSWEVGKSEPSISTLAELSKIFECSIDYIVGNENEMGIISGKSPISTENELLLSILRTDKQYSKLIKYFAKLSPSQKNELLKKMS